MSNKNIFQALNDVMSEVGAIGKDSKTTGYASFSFRGIDDVYNTLNPLFAKHGVIPIPKVLEHIRENRKTNKGGDIVYTLLTIEYTFYAVDGTSVTAVVMGEAMDSGDKGTNKAMSIAYKYACFQVLCIPTELQGDDPARVQDPDGVTHPPTTAENPVTEKQEWLCDGCGTQIDKALYDNTVEATGKAMCKSCAKKYKAKRSQTSKLEPQNV